jgi:outer membrane protein assembly factor BamB
MRGESTRGALARAFALGLLMATGESAGSERPPSPPLGSPEFRPTPDRPVGWRGDGTGRFPGATPPTTWSRRVRGATTPLRYQAARPTGEPGPESRPLEYFTLKDWLVAGPIAVGDPARDIDRDFLGGEPVAQPVEGGRAGPATWKRLRADVETQSRHDCNDGTCGQSYVDFVTAFGSFTAEGPVVKVDGDFSNKVAYAHTYLHSPTEATLRLQIAFEGAAAKVWLNGRPTTLDPKNRTKAFDVTLSSGWNRLLVKVSAAEGLGKIYTGRWISRWLAAAYLTPVGPVRYESRNIAWMTKMTGRSMSQPIVVDDRLFVGSGISDLLCLSKRDGRVLWLRTTTPYDALGPEERNAPAVKEKIEPLLFRLSRQNDEAVAAINAAVSPHGLSSDEAAELDRTLKEKRATEAKIHKAFEELDRKKYPPYSGNEVSSSNATPCSDGTRVYWACGGGLKGPGAQAIACFDLDGKRLWTAHEVLGSDEHGNHISPALVDGKLIYGAHTTLLALDARTGRTLWKIPCVMGTSHSPVVTRIGGTPVVITLKKVIRASDGAEICDHHLAVTGRLTTVVEDGVVYNPSRYRGWQDVVGMAAVRLPPRATGKGSVQVIWDPPSGKDLSMPLRGSNSHIASPLVVDGILYAVDMSGGLTAVDLQGRGLYRRWLDGYNRFNRFVYGVAASPTLAGKLIYVTDDAGYTHLLQPGPQFKEVGKNVLENIHFSGVGGNPCRQESFYTGPYFDGKAMYLRGEEYLYRIEERQGPAR